MHPPLSARMREMNTMLSREIAAHLCYVVCRLGSSCVISISSPLSLYILAAHLWCSLGCHLPYRLFVVIILAAQLFLVSSFLPPICGALLGGRQGKSFLACT